MTTAKSAGRAIGLAWLLQILIAAPLYTRILTPVTGRGFMVNAAGSATEIRIGLLFTLVASALTVAVAILAWPIVRRHSERMALVLLTLSILGVATMVNDTIYLRHLLYLSEQRAVLGAANDMLSMMAASARPSWLAAHFTNLVAGHSFLFVLCLTLFRFALVPRALAAAGVAATILSTSVVAAPLLGLPLRFGFVMPTALASLALIAWLLFRGLDESRTAIAAGAGKVHLAHA